MTRTWLVRTALAVLVGVTVVFGGLAIRKLARKG